MEKLTIISVGVGDLNLLTGQAIEFISNHKNIYISEERFSSLKELNPRIKIISYSKLQETIANSQKDIAIIVSGDFGFYSIAKTFIRIFNHTKDIQLINGISSIQYFAMKLRMVYHDWVSLSLHGNNINKLPAYITYNQKVFLLTGGKYSVKQICHILLDAGFSNLNIFVGENLSYPQENIYFGSLQELSQMDFHDLTVMLIQNPLFVEPSQPLTEKNFVASKTPINNDILRATLVNKLQLNPSDIVYNIGAGSGDVSVDIAKKVYSGLVYAFEQDEHSFKSMQKNKINNLTFNIFNFFSEVPFFENQYFKNNLLPPDKVLISSNFNHIQDIFKWILDLNPSCRFVLNANSLDKLNFSISCFQKLNVQPEVICINSFDFKNNQSIFSPQIPTFLISADIN